METVRAKPEPQCRCGGKTVYFRAYNGESLCSSCFTSSVQEKVKKTISKYGMLRVRRSSCNSTLGRKRLHFAVTNHARDHEGPRIPAFAITIDEGIDGYREESLKNAEKTASELSVPLIVRSYKDYFGLSLDEAMVSRSKKGLKITSCAACGPLRRRAIDQAAEELGVNVVATAHNLDDVLQTFYINLYSGDVERIGWLDPEFRPISDSFKLRRIKPAMENL